MIGPWRRAGPRSRFPTRPRRIAIIGTVGLPAGYGGFETLAANLAAYRQAHALPCELTVYCSAPAYPHRLRHYSGAELRYVPLKANGVQSILYDAVSLALAIARGADTILVLGVSGAFALPLARLLSRSRLVVNIDGLEWKRPKWSWAAARFLKMSEWLAVRFGHVIVADNRGIVDHVRAAYDHPAEEIAYGGDHATRAGAMDGTDMAVPSTAYALMLCRIEPENNIDLILDAFSHDPPVRLVAVGHWDGSDYGRRLKARYRDHPMIELRAPIFEPSRLFAIRERATLYVHGHSAGGTNPALVEMMHFAKPVLAFDCSYNRYTTEDRACYFASSEGLSGLLRSWDQANATIMGREMKEIADRRYTWEIVGGRYFALLGGLPPDPMISPDRSDAMPTFGLTGVDDLEALAPGQARRQTGITIPGGPSDADRLAGRE